MIRRYSGDRRVFEMIWVVIRANTKKLAGVRAGGALVRGRGSESHCVTSHFAGFGFDVAAVI